ncbi:hypothetical protein HZA38_04340 [Candidatus Peregrinibacteria bacterium]|nr:hypothetical protein [Candidatus Peregrinibacteria bacterium]
MNDIFFHAYQEKYRPKYITRNYLLEIILASLSFENFRTPLRHALRAIVRFIFDKHHLPLEEGIDIGCGATGEMVEQLLPVTQSQRSTWTQIDLNPSAVIENRSRHPSSHIEIGSYLHMDTSRCSHIVTGLSSLDTTAFVDRAVQQVATRLYGGGFLVHVQDMLPGWSVSLKEVLSRGEPFPYTVEIVPPKTKQENKVFPHNIQMYHTRNGVVSVMELFRDRLAKVIEQTGELKLLESEWFTAIGEVADPAQAYFYNSGFRYRSSNPSVQIASVVVTIAKKVSTI